MKAKVCKLCGSPIVFVRTPTGKAMPCDADNFYYRNDGGTDTVVTFDGRILKGTLTSNRMGTAGLAYRPHWASCPKAAEIRRGPRPEKPEAEQLHF